MQRPSGATSSRLEGRLGRITRFEYVNRAGEPVNPKTGKPYARPSENGELGKKSSKKGKRSLPIKKAGAMFGGLDPIPTDPTVDPPPRACFNCWQPGHSRKSCPRPKVNRMCNNCGRRNEDLSTCPRCARAHRIHVDQLIARRRGEVINPEDDFGQLYPAASEEEDNALDDVLQELAYHDQRAREMMMLEKAARDPNYQERQINMTVFQDWSRYNQGHQHPSVMDRLGRNIHEEREFLARQERERERELLEQQERERERELLEQQELERERERARLDRELQEAEFERLERERELEREFARQRERELELRERERMMDREQHREHRSHHQEHALQHHEHRSQHQEHRSQHQEHALQHHEQRTRHHEERRDRQQENGASRPETIHTGSFTSMIDPVKEFLELAKSIAHLTPETQELVMRQVIAERKEKAKLIAMQEREIEDPWQN